MFINRLQLCFLLLAAFTFASYAIADVTTSNLLINPGGELGTAPWQPDSVGPTLLRAQPMSLPSGVAIAATEGTHFFACDVNYSSNGISANSARTLQEVDARQYSGITGISVGMDVTGAGMTLVGDGLPVVRPGIVLSYEDSSHNSIGVEFVLVHQPIQMQSGTAIGLTDIRATVYPSLPSGTAFILADFRMETGMLGATVSSQVRVLAGIDDMFLSLTYKPIAGDYNSDGIVDAADFVVWRKIGGPQANYDEWRTHFGQTQASASSFEFVNHTASVPEPIGAPCVWLAGIWLHNVRRRFALTRPTLSPGS